MSRSSRASVSREIASRSVPLARENGTWIRSSNSSWSCFPRLRNRSTDARQAMREIHAFPSSMLLAPCFATRKKTSCTMSSASAWFRTTEYAMRNTSRECSRTRRSTFGETPESVTQRDSACARSKAIAPEMECSRPPMLRLMSEEREFMGIVRDFSVRLVLSFRTAAFRGEESLSTAMRLESTRHLPSCEQRMQNSLADQG
jgi:hypothetical protein